MKVVNIKNPKFLKKLNNKELELLSKDIREFLIDNISNTGGHLSSNLGVVDLTIAIHKVFNSPTDKIIFDVGHQSYTHKILTGRAKDFNTLRKYNGLSGFQKRSESIYDSYEAGHSSTSLSAALGFSLARDEQKKKHKVVAVIGDGSIGNGLSYEALNHIGSEKTQLLVILNDNEMSISKNVGALKNSLDKLRSNYKYKNAKSNTQNIISKIPLIGTPINKGITNIYNSIKSIYMKEGYFFEELGFKYYGPINGHDYNEMLMYLEMVKKEKVPVLLHVITEKGKGYKYAEEDKEGTWHGVGPFDKEKGEFIKEETDKISWSEVITNHLIELSKIDKNIKVITPATGTGSKLEKYKEKYKNRFIDVGIAEEHALVLANSLSLEGTKPFISMYSTFLQRGYDEIHHDIARMKGSVVIGVDRAGLVGADGETHQGIYDVAFLNTIPNMTIMAPKDSKEAGNMLYTAFNMNSPVAIRYSRSKTLYTKQNYELISTPSWEVINEGNDGYIITYGDFINNAIEVIDKLKKDNINIGLINARFIKPMDTNLLNKLFLNNKPLFIYEEVTKECSLGMKISYYMNENNYNSSLYFYSLPDAFIEAGTVNELLNKYELDINSIYKNIKKKLKTK